MTRRPGFRERLALCAIRGYQRFLSPYKGFSCALRSATGGDSCSAYGYRAIRRGGLRVGLRLLRQRMHLCGHVHRRPATVRHPLLHAQRGHCDLSCDVPSCDVPSCDTPSCDLPGCDLPAKLDWAVDALDIVSQCSGCDCGSCDWPRSRRQVRPSRDTTHLDAAAERIRQRARRDCAVTAQ
jgi:putative component of membrane protein insertase Oxa1/YidC/SpoIIIJ protein YidD